MQNKNIGYLIYEEKKNRIKDQVIKKNAKAYRNALLTH